jgi:NAD-dependent deacetylase
MPSDPSVLTRIAAWLAAAQRAVAFTGAGISTESGIPDFRSPGGVWSRYRQVDFSEFVASAAARQEYWRQKCEAHRDFAAAEPNAGHLALARWEQAGRLRGTITQNIDGLHQAAGSRRVLELHGTARQIGCLDCGARQPADALVDEFQRTGEVPSCGHCGGLLKHATVSFGQTLPEDVLAEAITWSREADLLLAIGSSLVVQPAAGLPLLAKRSGARLVIVNREETPLDTAADAVLREPIGAVLTAIEAALVGGCNPASG